LGARGPQVQILSARPNPKSTAVIAGVEIGIPYIAFLLFSTAPSRAVLAWIGSTGIKPMPEYRSAVALHGHRDARDCSSLF
jgi:hypothetical protein